jgi:hypothetical protein
MLPTKETELATIAPIGPVSEPPRAKYERLIVTAKEVPPATTVVVHPCPRLHAAARDPAARRRGDRMTKNTRGQLLALKAMPQSTPA